MSQKQPNYSKSQVFSACADELDALLAAAAPTGMTEVQPGLYVADKCTSVFQRESQAATPTPAAPEKGK